MLPAFLQTVVPELDRATGGAWRIICIDDGSKDNTFSIIAQEHFSDARISGVRLSRNFGHQAAVSVGLAYAEGEYIGVIDCDLQDPIEVLIQLYRKALEEELDVCYGVRGRRDAPVFLRFAYSLYYRIIERLAEHRWPKDAGDFCVMSARCHKVLLALPEHSRMMRGLRSWIGFKQSGLSYDRPARLHGTSKYNLRKLCALALQGLVAFSNVPLRLASITGLLMGCFSMLFGVLVLVNRLFPTFTLLGYWVGANPGIATLSCFLAFVFSILFICVGIIGEYLIVLLQEAKGRPTAVVESVLGSAQMNDAVRHVIQSAGSREPARPMARCRPLNCLGNSMHPLPVMKSDPQRIVYASAPMAVSMTDCWYDIAGLDHFWIQRRFEVLKSLAGSEFGKTSRVAEIGCGNGLVQRQIEDHYGLPVTGFDLNELALKKNVSRMSPIFCYDIHQRSPEFRAQFDLVLLFDVLEHIDDEARFLQSIRYHLNSIGTLVINVPAHQALYSKYDEAAGHVRRYSIGALTKALEQNGFKIRSYTYWGLPLVPLLVVRKVLLNWRRTEQGIISTGFDPGGRATNNSLKLLARCEFLPQRFVGTSLMAVVENQE